jgi:hypothetical protein
MTTTEAAADATKLEQQQQRQKKRQAKKNKRKRRKSRPVPAGERAASTREEFCRSHRISRSKYYELRKRGEGPDEMIVDGKHLISNESGARWRKQKERKAIAAA